MGLEMEFPRTEYIIAKYTEGYSVNAIARMLYDIEPKLRITDEKIKKLLRENNIELRPPRAKSKIYMRQGKYAQWQK